PADRVRAFEPVGRAVVRGRDSGTEGVDLGSDHPGLASRGMAGVPADRSARRGLSGFHVPLLDRRRGTAFHFGNPAVVALSESAGIGKRMTGYIFTEPGEIRPIRSGGGFPDRRKGTP